MSSQFDDLLADLGDTPTKASTNGGGLDDDFDPFGPTSGAEVTSNGGGDSGLLLDFTVSTEVTTTESSSNGVDGQFEIESSSTSGNPLYDMSSSNPLYELSSTGDNPLYDLDAQEDQPQEQPTSANPLYDFEETTTITTTSSSAPTNPLYDFENGDQQEEVADQDDLNSSGNAQQEEAESFSRTNFSSSDAGTNDADEFASTANNNYVDDANNDSTEFYQQQQGQEVEDRVQSGQFDDLEYSQEPPRQEDQQTDSLLEFDQQEQSFGQPGEESTSYTRTEIITQDEEQQQQQEEDTNPEPSAPVSRPPPPTVEVTEAPPMTPEEEDDQELDEPADQQLPDLVVREEGDEEEESVDCTHVDPAATTSGAELLTTTDGYGHDRREEDLEQYCMDREESDFVADEVREDRRPSHEQTLEEVPDRPREERSPSPARELGEEIVEEVSPALEEEPEAAPREEAQQEEEEPEATRQEEVQQEEGGVEEEEAVAPPAQEEAPESGEPAAPEEEEVIQDGRTVSKSSKSENRYSDSGLGSAQYSSQQFDSQPASNADFRQSNEQDIVHFSEMSSVKQQFESQPTPTPRSQINVQQEVMATEGGVYESQPQVFEQWQNEEEEEEGVHESQPVLRDDVARESDRDVGKDLPAIGTTSNIRARFLSQQSETSTSREKREITPPAHGAGGEYVSEPRSVVEKYEGKAEAGVFESSPQRREDVVTSETVLEEAVPESGFTKNVAARFKELEKQGSVPMSSGKREITPDRTGQVEYVSEPRGHVEHYEGKAESGVFESQPVLNPEVVRSGQEVEEQLPERGMAKNLANRFKQISVETTSPPSAGRAKREITPDTSGRTEYVSEPRGFVETHQQRVDAGVFENQPQEDATVVKSDDLAEEFVPERGFARNVAAKFRELESTAKSPPLSPGRRKEFTPPREDIGKRESGVYESTPEVKAEVVHADDLPEEKLPERGTAKNMAQRFKQMEAENKSPQTSKPKKEFTPPPPDSGVFENQPKQFQADYNRPAESGIVENQPVVREDVVKGTEPPKYEEELPERGMARNLVSRWRQMESESAKVVSPGSGGRVKEFTPPREEPRIAQQRSPRTPMSPPSHNQMDNGSVHPSELPGQYQPAAEPSVFESNPDRRGDVYREEDTDWTDGMPKKDTAKKMLARFQKIQTEAKQQESQGHTPRKAQNVRHQ